MNVKLEINFWVQYFLAPELQVFVSSLEKCQNFSKTSTPQISFTKFFLSAGQAKVAHFPREIQLQNIEFVPMIHVIHPGRYLFVIFGQIDLLNGMEKHPIPSRTTMSCYWFCFSPIKASQTVLSQLSDLDEKCREVPCSWNRTALYQCNLERKNSS